MNGNGCALAWALLLLPLLSPLLAGAEEAFRDDFDQVAGWVATPAWVGASAARGAVTETADGVAHFAVREPGRAMKWRRVPDGVELEWAPWLVLRYRAVGLDLERLDYLLHVTDSGPGDGARLLRGPDVRADGRWHTRCVNLVALGLRAPLRGLAVGCQAGADGRADVWLDSLVVTDTPPADAEGYEAEPAGAGQSWPVDLAAAEAWALQPGWLGNHGPGATVAHTADGVRFAQPEAGTGAKWSRALAQPVVGAGWVALRYRARGLAGPDDYALYLASQGGGQATHEQQPVKLSGLLADGAWHLARARVSLKSVQTLAVQVQAARPDSWLELGALTFSERQPPIDLRQVLDCRAGFPVPLDGWRPLALPAGNAGGPALLRLLGQQGWFTEDRVTVDGVPFALRAGAQAVTLTPIRELGEVVVPLSGQAAELYLLLGLVLPAQEDPSYRPTPGGACPYVHRFVAQVEYADGLVDEQLPYHLAGRVPRLSPGVAAYALALEPGRPLRRLVLRDRYRRGALALVAATLADSPGPASAATRLVPTAQAVAPQAVAPRATGVTVGEQTIVAVSRTVTLVLDRTRGLRVVAIENHCGGEARLLAKPGPLFSLELPGVRLTSDDFAVGALTPAPHGCRVALSHAAARVEVVVDVADEREIGLSATCTLAAPAAAARSRFTFPQVANLAFSADPDDTWYWMPRQGSVVANAPTTVRARYAGAGNPAQVFGGFSPRLGTGLYLMTQDLEAVPRAYLLSKRAGQLSLGVEYQPFTGGSTPRTVLGCHTGGWQAQLDRYREWVATWYRPMAPRKDWFRRVVNFRQQFLHFGMPTPSGLFDAQTKEWRFPPVLAADAAAFGGVDYLHLFDWGWDPQHGRCGDYEPWGYLGGAEPFRRALAEVQAGGVPVGLYLEGYLSDPPATISKAHGAEWQLLNAAGQPYTNFAPSFHLCPAVGAWQDYLSSAYARAQRETGAVGYYLDEFGFAAHYDCYNPTHGHPVPQTPVRGEREMLRKVRAALGQAAVLYTEECPTDVNGQYQDGSFTYCVASGTDDLSPTRLNLYRFLFPSFRTIEIIHCDGPLSDNVEAVQRVLFGGEAIWLEGTPERWFTPEARAAIALSHRVQRANADCFAGDYPTPLVPTRFQGLYANRFASRADERGRTCWTVYNAMYRTARGGLLAVRHWPGARYRDEVSGREVRYTVEGDQAVLELTIGPREVGVVSRAVGWD